MVGSMQHILAFLSLPGGSEWLILLALIFLIFGAKRLPELARSVGRSLTEFKRGINEAKDSADEATGDTKKTKNGEADDAKEASGVKDSHSTR